MSSLHNFDIQFEDINPKPWFGKVYNRVKAPGRLKVIPPGAFKLGLTKPLKLAILSRTIKAFKKGITRMSQEKVKVAKVKKSKLGLYFDMVVASLVILLNELAAFLYIRDNIKDQHMGYGIAALVVFMSTYIVFKLIARLVR